MNKITLTLLYGLLMLIVACDKPDAVPPNPVTNNNDTLNKPDTIPRPNPVNNDTIPKPNPVNNNDTLGVGWSQQKISQDHLIDVVFHDAMVGYAAGYLFYKTNDGGTTWINVRDTFQTGNLFLGPDGTVHAIKEGGKVYKRFTNWAQNSTTTLLNEYGRGNDLYFTSSNNGFLSTDNGILKTTDGGKKWDRVTNAPVFRTDSYSSLYFTDTVTGWVFTGDKIFRSNGSVNNWTACNLPPNGSGYFTSIYAVSSNIIYAASWEGNILKSIDGGRNFQQVAKFTSPASMASFTDIQFLNDLNGYACQANRIYHTKDGGHNWTTVVALSGIQIAELYFLDVNQGWACTSDGRILKYKR